MRHPVDMAAHHVAAELIADSKRALKVDAPPLPPFPQRCHRERLGADIEGDRRTPLARLDADHGEAYARIGDRRAKGNGRRIVAAFDPEPAQLTRRLDIHDLPDVADNP